LFTLCFHNYLKLIVFGNTILFLTIFSPLYAENLQYQQELRNLVNQLPE